MSPNPVVTAILDRELIVQSAELHFDSRAEQIMSMPALRPRRWTIDQVELLIDQRQGMSPRYELVDGELLVTPAPSERHQRIVLRLALLIQRFVSREGIGEIRLGPSLLPLTSGERFEPDLHVVPAVDGRLRPDLHSLLVCEVLSPRSSRHDRITKRRAFQRNAIPEYWIIDGDAEAFEIWHPNDERAALIDDRIVWQPSGLTVAFELDVKQFFADIASDSPLPAV